jgi:hypothetical protein
MFISADCKSIVNFSSRHITLHHIDNKSLTRNCPTITSQDTIFILAGGLEGDAAFWEISGDNVNPLPIPPVSVIGGTFIEYGRRLLLVGAKMEGKGPSGLQPGPILIYIKKKKEWSEWVNPSSFRATEKATVHPVLLEDAGVCIQAREASSGMVLFAGGTYQVSGNVVANQKVLWLDLGSGDYGAYSASIPALKNPHIAMLTAQELIVVGGSLITTNKKSKAALTVGLNSGEIKELSPLQHPLATCNIAPVAKSEYVIFFSWPRITFYNKVHKTFISRSLRKSDAFRAVGLAYKRHDSMGSDLSSAYETDFDFAITQGIVPVVGVKRSIGVEGSYGIERGFSVGRVKLNVTAPPKQVKQKIEYQADIEPEIKAPKPKASAHVEEVKKVKRRRVKKSSSSSSDEGLKIVKPVVKLHYSSEEEDIAPVNQVKGGKTATKTTYGLQLKSTRRASSSSSSSERRGVPGRVLVGLSALKRAELKTGVKIGAVKVRKSSSSSSERKATIQIKTEKRTVTKKVVVKAHSSSSERSRSQQE